MPFMEKLTETKTMNTQKPKHLSIAMLITLSTALFGLTACDKEPTSPNQESYNHQQKAAQKGFDELEREVQKLDH